MRRTKFQFLTATLLTFSMVQAIALCLSDRQLNIYLLTDQQAYARNRDALTTSRQPNRSQISGVGLNSL